MILTGFELCRIWARRGPESRGTARGDAAAAAAMASLTGRAGGNFQNLSCSKSGLSSEQWIFGRSGWRILIYRLEGDLQRGKDRGSKTYPFVLGLC